MRNLRHVFFKRVDSVQTRILLCANFFKILNITIHNWPMTIHLTLERFSWLLFAKSDDYPGSITCRVYWHILSRTTSHIPIGAFFEKTVFARRLPNVPSRFARYLIVVPQEYNDFFDKRRSTLKGRSFFSKCLRFLTRWV